MNISVFVLLIRCENKGKMPVIANQFSSVKKAIG